MLLVPEFVPQLKNLKPLEWKAVPLVLDFMPHDLVSNRGDESGHASKHPTPLRDPERSLDRFYEALRRAEADNAAVVRILHYGDSPTTADLITSDTRELLQERFGNAGHGFHLIAKPWAWYEHRGVRVDSKGWSIDPATQPSLADGIYGLGGVSFRGMTGAHATFRIRESGHTQIELSYLAVPGGGKLILSANGRDMAAVDTAGSKYSPAWAKFTVPEGARGEDRCKRGPRPAVRNRSGEELARRRLSQPWTQWSLHLRSGPHVQGTSLDLSIAPTTGLTSSSSITERMKVCTRTSSRKLTPASSKK
jgi:hypothetical protein